MFLLEKIQYEMEVIDQIVDEIYSYNKEWYFKFNDNAGDILGLVQQLIMLIPALEQIGIELPKDTMENQISSINEAVGVKDFMFLADVLKYEIKDTLGAFEELVKGGVINNEELL